LEWAGVELRHLAALQALADEGSISRAAARLGYTQPAVSQQLAALERLLETRLYDRRRGPAGTRLTPAGERLLIHARAMLARIEIALTDVKAARDGHAGVLTIGTFPSAGTAILAPSVTTFRKAAPGVEMRLIESTSDLELLRLLERGQLDVTFAMLPLRDGPFAWRKLMDDPYVLVVGRASGALADAETVSLSDLSELPLIEFRHSEERVRQSLRLRGLPANVIFRSDDNPTVMALAAGGLGVAVVPRLTVQPGYDIRILELPDLPPRQIAIVWHRDRERRAADEAFIDAAAHVAAEAQGREGFAVI
jgi:molybdate transport repressor ModE-like protein